MTLAFGTKLGRYEIRSKLGEGGMGEVYMALDTKLDRKVAVKILPADVAADRNRMIRFVHEAKAASALNHPNIITIHEIDQTDSGHFIASEFIDGETLRERMRNAPMKVSEALDIATQIAGALAAAHAAGIVHRDIKPENVMLRSDGIVKVLDFGLAKLTEQLPTESVDTEAPTRIAVYTEPGVVMGTALYMSPEQARGLHVDARTDIFSFGVLIYEMIAGRLPFDGSNANEVLAAILSDKEPVPLTRYAREVPSELERIVEKALRKDREQRYQTIKDMLLDLTALKRRLEFTAEVERSHPPEITLGSATLDATASGKARQTMLTTGRQAHRLRLLIAMAILVAIAVGVSYVVYSWKRAGVIESIAVLPFVNESGNADVEYLSDGMTETLINSLSQLPGLNVKARSSVFRYKGKDVSPRTVGTELGVQAVLNGRVVQHGDDLTLYLSLVNATTENQLWGKQYDQKLTNLVTLQSEIARDVSENLKARLTRADEQKVTKSYTANPEAYRLYLQGRYFWNKRTTENLKKAIQEFQQAAQADPNYALAYVGLADSYVLLEDYAGTPSSETLPQARNYATRAMAIDDTLAEAHASVGYINDRLWQWAEAEREYKRALELNPNYATAHQWYYSHLLIVGRQEEATEEIKRAQELDPLSVVININVAVFYLIRGDVSAAVEQSKKTIELDPNFSPAHSFLGLTYLKQGRNDLALAEIEKAVELSHKSTGSIAGLAYTYAVTEKRNEALAIVKELEEKYARGEAQGWMIAGVYVGLGQKDEAFAWLEKDFQARNSSLSVISFSPSFEPLRSDPRYADLLRRMNLPQ